MEPGPAHGIQIVVIGGSAGALTALRTLVSRLPADFQTPILVVIHIPGDSPSFLPAILNSSGPLRAVQPEDNEALKAGMIYVAPPDRHLLVGKGYVTISRGPRENRHRPAVDPLFRSAARCYRSQAAAVVLSGELDDGAAGLMAIRMRGGIGIVQEPGAAASPQMPQSAIQYAGADYVLPPAEIAAVLTELSSRARKEAQPVSEPKNEQKHLENENPEPERGIPSNFACPECHGVLREIKQGDLLRFRCRVGHAYTADALRVALSDSCEDALWAAIRVLEEKASLLRRLARPSSGKLAESYREDAEAYDRHADTVRKILLENQAVESTEPSLSEKAD